MHNYFVYLTFFGRHEYLQQPGRRRRLLLPQENVPLRRRGWQKRWRWRRLLLLREWWWLLLLLLLLLKMMVMLLRRWRRRHGWQGRVHRRFRVSRRRLLDHIVVVGAHRDLARWSLVIDGGLRRILHRVVMVMVVVMVQLWFSWSSLVLHRYIFIKL